MRRLLPMAALLALGITGLQAQSPLQNPLLDCGPGIDVPLTPATPRSNVRFQGTQGEAVYIRLLANSSDPGFSLIPPVVADPFGTVLNPRVRNSGRTGDPVTAGGTPADLAGSSFIGLEFDLNTDGTFTLQLTSGSAGASASIHVVMTRLNRPCGSGNPLTCGRSNAGGISITVPGQVNSYQFSVQTGDVVSFRLLRVSATGSPITNTAFILAVYAADPAQNNRPFAVNVEPLTGRLTFKQISTSYVRYDWTATITGTVTVLVAEASGTLGGNYFVSATKLTGGCGGTALTCNSAVDGQLSTPLTFGFYTMQVNGGDTYQFHIARSDTSGGFAPSAEIFDSAGTSVAVVGPVSPSGHAAAVAPIKFPSSGKFTVVVAGPLDGSLGAYSLSTLRVNRPCDGLAALSCSIVVDGTVSGLVRNQVYTLSAAANDAFLVRLLRPDTASLFRPRIEIYDKTAAVIKTLNTTDLARATFTAPSDGDYTLVVTDSYDGSQTGAYTLSLLRLNRPCGAGTLSCGAPSAGSLPRALSSSVYSYTAAAAESFSVRMLPDSGSPQPAVEVYDSLGNSVGQPLPGNFAGVDAVKPAAGPYTIIATDNSRTPAASSFTLDLLRTTNACSVPAAQGATVNGVVTAAAPFLAYRIPATKGDVLALRSSSSTAGFASQMELYDPDGVRLDSGVFNLSNKAAASGAYTVILGAATPRTAGGYSFSWQLLNQPAGALPLICGGSTAGALSASNQFRYYSLAAGAGDTLRLLFTRISDNFSPQMELFDPGGARMAAGSDVTQAAAAAGNYLVLVSPATSGTETGSYSVAFQRPNNPCLPAALTCGQTALRQVNLPGQLDTFTFNGTGGDQVTLRFTTRSGGYTPFAEMYSTAGALLTTSSNGLLRRALPASGGYTLLVRDRTGVALGSYRVNLQDDTNACQVNDTEAPVITLVRPTGGEVLAGGTTFRIQWLSDDNVGVAGHDIALSTDAGKTFGSPFASLGGALQTYDWSLPADVAPTRTAVLRVTATDVAGNAQSATTDLLTLIGSGFTPNSSATYAYDGMNRLIQVSLGDGSSIQYTWDASGNLAAITISGQ